VGGEEDHIGLRIENRRKGIPASKEEKKEEKQRRPALDMQAGKGSVIKGRLTTKK